MKCPECGKPTIVKDSRESGADHRRRRECLNGHKFTTMEYTVGTTNHDLRQLVNQLNEMLGTAS